MANPGKPTQGSQPTEAEWLNRDAGASMRDLRRSFCYLDTLFMPRSLARWQPHPHALLVLLGFGCVLLVGCTTAPRVRHVIGPNGSPMLHVSCAGDQGACIELAGRNCPTGYDFSPLFDPRDNNFLVTCHSGQGPAGTIALAPPSIPAPAPRPTDKGVEQPRAISRTTDSSSVDFGY